MDLATHVLMGTVLVPESLALRYPVVLTATAVAGSVAPDVDAVTAALGPERFFRLHRGLTHSMGGGVVLSAALAGIAHALTGEPFLLLFAFAALGHLSHLLLDLPLPWPIPALWPVTGRRFTWNFMGFGDRFALVVLGTLVLLGLLLPQGQSAWVRPAAAALLAAYVAMRLLSLSRARAVVRGALPPDLKGSPIHLAGPPVEAIPRRWRLFVVRAGASPAYHTYTVDANRGTVLESNVIASDPPRAAVARSESARSLQALRRRFPHVVARVSEEDGWTVVRWRDIGALLSNLIAVEAFVRLAPDGRIAEDRLVLGRWRPPL